MFGNDNNNIPTILDYVPQPENYFEFTEEGELREINSTWGSNLDSELEFLVTRDKIEGGNWYGIGMGRSTYYNSEIVKDLTRFAHEAGHKSAVPPVVVISENIGSSSEEASTNAAATSTAFEALRSGSAVTLSGMVKVQELKGGSPKEISDVI